MNPLVAHRFKSITTFKKSNFDENEEIPHIDDLKIEKQNVCDNDDRQPSKHLEKPFKYICELHLDFNGYLFRGSGFFISPRCVITAGHCLFSHEMGWVNSVKVIPGALKGERPFSFEISENFETTEFWYYNALDDYDHGAIFLKTDTLYNQIKGFFAYTNLKTVMTVINSGYPKDKSSVQFYNGGKVKELTNTKRLHYMLDTNKGSSGSPVFIENNKKFEVVGVHTEGGCPNSAIKVNNEVIEVWDKWINKSRILQSTT
ncbi:MULTISPECIES: trypsin-like serine peptidase [Flavobacteriaceae]|uniref:trypsin-like serine peptidase n=1 Tax=Flavobacteriaceae TaxID=49546 RepID=UPI00234B1FA6|nr:trypsin-like serine protease [Muricauda sp. SP22]MDC6362549.1 trypsin-like serine protease [Muricauda sp. SP22]